MKCRQCGSNDIKKISENMMQCNHCGSTIYIQNGNPISGIFSQKSMRISFIFISLMIMIGLLGYLISNISISKSDHSSNNIQINKDIKSNTSKNSIEKLPEPKGEFLNVSPVKDSIGNIYFLGIYENTGKIPIRKPEVTVTLHDAKGNKIAAGRGFGMHNFLMPQEKTPIKILIQDAPNYHSFRINQKAEPPFIKQEKQGVVEISEVKLKQDDYYYQFHARVTNKDSVPLEYVQIGIVFYDDDKKIIGIDTMYTEEKKLESGDFTILNGRIYSLKKPPTSYELFYTSLRQDS